MIRCARQASIKHLTNCWGKFVKISSVLTLCFGTYVLVGSKKGAEEMQYDSRIIYFQTRITASVIKELQKQRNTG